jgi:plasmid segregation protein ParM
MNESPTPQPQLLPIDIGYGYTKGLSPGKAPFICPSIVTPARDIRYSGGLSDAGGIAVSVNGSQYFVGDLAERQGRGGGQTMSADRVDSDELLALFYAAASSLVKVATEQVVVVTGLPVADYDDRNKARLKRALMGNHVADAGTPRVFDVVQVVVVPQAVGCLYGLVLDRDGRVTQNKDLQRGKVAVIDVGQFTTNYVTTDKLEYIDRLSTSQEIGVSRLLLDLQRDLRDDYGLNLEKLSLVDKAVRAGYIEVRGKQVDISAEIEHRVAQLGDAVMAQATSLWANGADLTAVVLTGGGAHLLAERVKSAYSHTRVTPESQFSNVQGYLRLALANQRRARG